MAATIQRVRQLKGVLTRGTAMCKNKPRRLEIKRTSKLLDDDDIDI